MLGTLIGLENSTGMVLETFASGTLTLIGILSYFAFFLAWSAVTHAFVTLPLWAHFSETLTVIDPGSLGHIRQRARDDFEEAEGFAEALDVGAAI